MPSTSPNATIQFTIEYIAQDHGSSTLLLASPVAAGPSKRLVNDEKPNLTFFSEPFLRQFFLCIVVTKK
jgi:hypothetical protein